MAEQGCNVPAATQHTKNHHVLVINTVEDNVFADGKGPQAGAQILVAGTPEIGIAGEKKEPVRDGANEAVGNIHTAALGSNVTPNAVEVGIGQRRTAVLHRRGVCCSAARRARPRCVTCWASSRMDSCVIARPSPRAREASASSTAARISARLRSRSSHKER